MPVTDLVPHRFPWEPAPLDEKVELLARDVAYIVTHTAVIVQSERAELRILVNTPRGQIVPRGTCKFTDGTTVEFQDIGAPQPGAPEMLVGELMVRTWNVAASLGLELA